MKKGLFRVFGLALLGIAAASCKKETPVPPAPVIKPLATLGMYEYASGSNKRVFIPITKVGDQTVLYYGIFDTGSTGMTIDATGILPASMITSSGITVVGDSVNVSGITVTSKQFTISYGDKTSTTKEYGNLAYAPITIGDQYGNISTRRIPIFMYYKVMNTTTNTQYAAHSNDVFGVGPGTSYVSSLIASPLSYFDTSSGVTSGFKLATFSSSNFNSNGNYVTGLLTIGLTPADLAPTSGFIMHPLSYATTGGYSPNIPATVTYGSTSVSTQILFDTGTPSTSIIEDRLATIGNLPANTVVTITTNKGFTYTYTTTNTANLTQVQNPNNTNDIRTIMALDFFISNEYLTDYTNHQIGLKNN